ncbi:MAG TPA: CopD family protein [Acetobacteraceae bacterium]|nr:CopD family protein [Acetobacteraceae bacterium]
MQPVTNPWGWVLAVHILCIVVWVGGMFFAVVVVRPSITALEPAQRIALHNRVFRRFFLVIWHAMPVALISGYAMAIGLFGGMANLPWNVNAMQAIGLLMAAIFLLAVFGPYRRFRAAVSTARAAEAAERIRRLIVLNLVLGVINIFLAAI